MDQLPTVKSRCRGIYRLAPRTQPATPVPAPLIRDDQAPNTAVAALFVRVLGLVRRFPAGFGRFACRLLSLAERFTGSLSGAKRLLFG